MFYVMCVCVKEGIRRMQLPKRCAKGNKFFVIIITIIIIILIIIIIIIII